MLTHSFSPLGTSTLLVFGPPPERPDPDVAALRRLTVFVFVAPPSEAGGFSFFCNGRFSNRCVFVCDAVISAEAPAHFSRSEVDGSWLDRCSTSVNETVSDPTSRHCTCFFWFPCFTQTSFPLIAMPFCLRLFPSAPQTRKRLAQPVRAGNSARHDPSAVGASLHCNLQFFQFLFLAVSRACSLLICADNFLTCRPAVTLLLRLRTCAACGRNRMTRLQSAHQISPARQPVPVTSAQCHKQKPPTLPTSAHFVSWAFRRLDLVPWGTPVPEASPRAKNVDCCDLGLSPA